MMPQEIQLQLKNILRSIKELPSHIHSYSAFRFLEDTVKAYIKVNPILSELKSETVKNWHWKQLFKALKLENCFNLSEMTIGNVWNLDLKKNEQIIKKIIAQVPDKENENEQIINDSVNDKIPTFEEITLLEKHKSEQIIKDGVAQTFGEMTLKECFTYLLFDNKIVGYIKSVLINTVHAIFTTKVDRALRVLLFIHFLILIFYHIIAVY
ncbi:dynein heavy chain [Gigaspora margarita]|uniref:Dynein heavy chain n=1 Tax=Gigaspora margarita TaxID=4874 RepID=A0A8H4A8W8_GIGMA|nr:dynein heavy chain [Gigaspora margarita]